MYVFAFQDEEAGMGESDHTNRKFPAVYGIDAESALYLAVCGELVEDL